MNTFKFAGISRLKGTIKARFANDQMRVKVLAKTGHSDIDLIELKNPMTKAEAVAYLLSIDFDNGNTEIRAALDEANEKRNPEPKAIKILGVTVPTAGSKDAPKKEAKKPKQPAKPKVTADSTDAAFEDAPY